MYKNICINVYKTIIIITCRINCSIFVPAAAVAAAATTATVAECTDEIKQDPHRLRLVILYFIHFSFSDF